MILTALDWLTIALSATCLAVLWSRNRRGWSVWR